MGAVRSPETGVPSPLSSNYISNHFKNLGIT